MIAVVIKVEKMSPYKWSEKKSTLFMVGGISLPDRLRTRIGMPSTRIAS